MKFSIFNLGWGMKHSDFSSGVRDEAFRLLIWGEGWSILTFYLGRGMKYSDFSSGARDEVFRLFIWGEGWSIPTFNLGLNTGPLGKRLENQEKRNLCLWKEICAHEGEKWGLLTKTDRGSPMKRLGASAKKLFVFMKAKICPWKGKERFFTKTDRGSPMKKAGKSGKKATCVYEGENVPMKGKSTGFW